MEAASLSGDVQLPPIACHRSEPVSGVIKKGSKPCLEVNLRKRIRTSAYGLRTSIGLLRSRAWISK